MRPRVNAHGSDGAQLFRQKKKCVTMRCFPVEITYIVIYDDLLHASLFSTTKNAGHRHGRGKRRPLKRGNKGESRRGGLKDAAVGKIGAAAGRQRAHTMGRDRRADTLLLPTTRCIQGAAMTAKAKVATTTKRKGRQKDARRGTTWRRTRRG